LITKHEVVPAKQGNKYVFHIDKEWKWQSSLHSGP
jgi:hypothetical protein